MPTDPRTLWAILTPSGRIGVVVYALRRLFIRPAPDELRCFMGAPVADEIRCPRFATEDGIWCRRHHRNRARETLGPTRPTTPESQRGAG